MTPVKKSVLIVLFLSMSYFASGQSLSDIHAGLYTPILSSSTLKSTPGFGMAFGGHTQAMVNRRLDFFTEDNLYVGGFNVSGFGYGVTTSTSGPIYTTTNNNFLKSGLNYSLGFDYYPIRDKLSVGAGLFVSIYTVMDLGDDNAPLGAAPADPNAPVFRAEDLSGFNYDYGLNLGIRYRLQQVQFSLGYYQGFNNMASKTSDPNVSATVNDIMLDVHFLLREFSISKPCENELLK